MTSEFAEEMKALRQQGEQRDQKIFDQFQAMERDRHRAPAKSEEVQEREAAEARARAKRLADEGARMTSLAEIAKRQKDAMIKALQDS